MPSSQAPKRLYKYRSFNVNTLRLLSEAEVYYASPSSFNDPLDSNPTIQIDVERPTLEKLLYAMLLSSVGKDEALKQIGNHRYMSTEHGDYRTDPETNEYYMRMLATHMNALLHAEFGRRGVFSLAARWDNPLMWSHYADEHRGLCIEYNLVDTAFENLRAVDYRRPRSIKVSDILDWKVRRSKAAHYLIEETFFLAKAPQWRYEREWRDVASETGPRSAPARVSAVHFGLRCDTSVITTLVKLHSTSEHPMKFYIIYPLDNTFRLRRRLVDVGEVEAIGLRNSAILDFKDAFVDNTDA
jgi:hypothetical protein